jgi:acyl carrier protein
MKRTTYFIEGENTLTHTEESALKNRIYNELLIYLEDLSCSNTEYITYTTPYSDIEELDSLEITELFLFFEDKLDIEFPHDLNYVEVKNIEQTANYIQEKKLIK